MSAAEAIRPTRHDGWTLARRQCFLAALGEGANISLAAPASGMSRQSAYVLRRRDAAFARAWDNALAELAARQQREALAILIDLEVRALRKIGYRENVPGHRQPINLVSTSRGHASLAGHERIG